jgi:ssDNA-binding Zn-finger/Zn-ribbon topoisomerase 1
MLESQLSTLTPRAVAHPSCPQCQGAALVQSRSPGRSGFEHWTLRCTKCGNIHGAQVQADPMKSEAIGWLAGDLHAPT